MAARRHPGRCHRSRICGIALTYSGALNLRHTREWMIASLSTAQERSHGQEVIDRGARQQLNCRYRIERPEFADDLRWPFCSLQQTVVGHRAGNSLAEHDNSGEATLFILSGKLQLISGENTWKGSTGDLGRPQRAPASKPEDVAFLLTVAK